MPQTTIITAWEVVRYSPESNKFPPAYVEPHIYTKEQLVAREYLGQEFYAALLADKVDYGVLENWESGTVYASGDSVDYFGVVMTSIVSDNSYDPSQDLENQYWIVADKFETACYNRLWIEGQLRDFLAFFIIPEAYHATTYPAGGKGITEWTDDGGMRDGAGSKSASASTMQMRLNTIRQQAFERQQNMAAWMCRQNDAGVCDFAAALPIAGRCANPQAQATRRIALKTNHYGTGRRFYNPY